MNIKKGNWKISLKSLISVKWEKHFPRLVVHEKYEQQVKWILRALTVFGIISSIIAFPTWYTSILFTVILFLIEQFFERSVFLYTSIYIQPVPYFDYDTKEWKGMAFAFPQDSDPSLLNVVGCAFATKEFAHKFFELLRAWNYNDPEDKNNNICLSFIFENEKEYSTYLYPNANRKTVEQFFQRIEESQAVEKYGKKHQQLIFQVA